jgi:hypothetical protein
MSFQTIAFIGTAKPPFIESIMLLAQRNPSLNWEPLPLDSSGQHVAWVWFRPASVPYGLMFVVPPTVFADAQVATGLSVRQLLIATGLDDERILYWTFNGLSFDTAGGTSPMLDQPLPPPPPGMNINISVWIEPSPSLAVPPMMTAATTAPVGQAEYPSGGTASGTDARSLEAIDSHWGAILQMEVRIASIRKELGGNISRLNSLNRDLNSDERRTCDSKDLQAWTDARRWLRDSISSLSRSVKEIDTGITSGAGQRHKFEEIYRKYVIPKVSFAGVAQSVNEFESYRKTMQNVLSTAQASIAKSGREAESRANAVLTRISAKMRSIRRKD